MALVENAVNSGRKDFITFFLLKLVYILLKRVPKSELFFASMTYIGDMNVGRRFALEPNYHRQSTEERLGQLTMCRSASDRP